MKPASLLFPRSRPCAGGTSEPWFKALGLVLGLGLLLAGPVARAQPGSGGPGPGIPPPDPTAVPLDGGVSLLLAGGAAYAIRRLRRKRV